MTYSQFGCCGNHQISANYVVDNLVMCENRVNTHTHTHTHTHSHRANCTENILNVKELAIPFSQVLLTVSSDLYLRNGAPPLRGRHEKHCIIILRRYQSALIVPCWKRRIFSLGSNQIE